MIVQVDLNLCAMHGLDPNAFVLMLKLQKYGSMTADDLSPHDVGTLSAAGFILIENGKAKLTNAASTLISPDKNECWQELLETYPSTVKDDKTGNTRVLHAIDPDASSNAKAKAKYLKYLASNPLMHRRIIKALKAQLGTSGNHYYLPGLETWINNCEWEKYFHLTEDQKYANRNSTDYGTQLR